VRRQANDPAAQTSTPTTAWRLDNPHHCEGTAFNGVGRLDWGFGPAGEEAVISGIDVLVLKGDKIGAIYTFLNQRKK
jgi:hypothetical protein